VFDISSGGLCLPFNVLISFVFVDCIIVIGFAVLLCIVIVLVFVSIRCIFVVWLFVVGLFGLCFRVVGWYVVSSYNSVGILLSCC